LDLAALHARGVAMGLVEPGTAPTDPPVKDLVFAPGLSTTARPGMVSGRGFGGDVVRKSIERLNGSIRVETAAGVGTVFTITLPLTLAITRALLVRHGGRLYAIPLFFAEHLFDLEEARVVESLGARRLKLGEAFVPVRSLSEVFGAESSAPASGPVLILRVGEQRLAVQVDGVVAQEEIVVKGLGELLSGHPVLAGVTIRGNGELVLILDVPGVLERVFGAPRKAAPTSAPGESPPLLRSTQGRQTQGGESRVAAGAVAPNRAAPPDLADEPGSDPVPQDFEDLGAAGAPEPPHQGTAGGAAFGRSVEPPEEAPALPGGASTPGPEGPLRVLFVDDSVSVRKVAERALLGLGVQVAVAVDGLDAMEKLRAQRFDLVFTDLEMPRMHGYELIRELRFLPSYRSLPVVVVSSRSGQKHQDQARALGATDYLTKPFNAETLDAALRRWASRPGAPDRGEEPR
jgi:chemosensory pili system protein ChpA (sensor histidine kinase/response regulator)